MTKLFCEIRSIIANRKQLEMRKFASNWFTRNVIGYNDWDEIAARRRALQIQDPEIRTKVEQGIKNVRGSDGSPGFWKWNKEYLFNPDFRDFANDYIYGDGVGGKLTSWSANNVANIGAMPFSNIATPVKTIINPSKAGEYLFDNISTTIRGGASALDLVALKGAGGLAKGVGRAVVGGAKSLGAKGMKEGLKETSKSIGKAVFPKWKQEGLFGKLKDMGSKGLGATVGVDTINDMFVRNNAERLNRWYTPEPHYEYNITYPKQINTR